MTNTEESSFMVPLVEADFSPVISLEFYKSLSAKGYGKVENGDTNNRKQLNKADSPFSGF